MNSDGHFNWHRILSPSLFTPPRSSPPLLSSGRIRFCKLICCCKRYFLSYIFVFQVRLGYAAAVEAFDDTESDKGKWRLNFVFPLNSIWLLLYQWGFLLAFIFCLKFATIFCSFFVWCVVVGSVSRSDVNEKAPEWKKLKSEELGISTSKISRPTRMVLNGLRKRGVLDSST